MPAPKSQPTFEDLIAAVAASDDPELIQQACRALTLLLTTDDDRSC